MTRPILIGNSSGFYGDRDTAMREMVEGGPLDVLTGDYLAELTMLILWKARQKDPSAGYARSVLGQLEHVLGTCLDRGVKVVNNAGGLNPAGLAEQIGALAERLGLHPKIAYVTGDDLLPRLDELTAGGHPLTHLDTGQPLSAAASKPLTANAYLGGWGITAALAAGADVVVCPRVTDASLVTGPAAWWHGWQRNDYDQLAGGVLAGHVIECGPQATGGNYSFLAEVTDRRYPGFPIAEVSADGSAVITKHPGTGGLVSAGTVTAQLLYEIAEPAYVNPDVIAHFDTATLSPDGPDRVRISGTRGSPPPPTAKVAMNLIGGFRNTMTLVLTGLDIEAKAAWARQELFGVLGGEDQYEEVDVRLLRFDSPDAPTNEQATAHLRITVKDGDPRKVGRRFSNATMELALGGYAGFHTTTPPTAETAFGVYWPALVPADIVEHAVVLPDGSKVDIRPAERSAETSGADGPQGLHLEAVAADETTAAAAEPTRPVPLGLICGARSGDKGGNANVGFWARDPAAYGWLRDHLTVARLRALLTEAAGLDVRRFELPNLCALNFVIVGLLGQGVAASARPDPQAKGLGEYLLSRLVEVPVALLAETWIAETGIADSGRHD
jgi:Acyclic terpene utilisation family protein AtuA